MSDTTRPTIGVVELADAARRAVDSIVAELQEGWDTGDATITDRHLSADVAWGSPFGATVQDADTLTAIHRRLKAARTGGSSSRYRVERVLPISRDAVVAQVARLALGPDGEPIEATDSLDGTFSEMALYVLVRREDAWWIAAGHNTPIRAGGAT